MGWDRAQAVQRRWRRHGGYDLTATRTMKVVQEKMQPETVDVWGSVLGVPISTCSHELYGPEACRGTPTDDHSLLLNWNSSLGEGSAAGEAGGMWMGYRCTYDVLTIRHRIPRKRYLPR